MQQDHEERTFDTQVTVRGSVVKYLQNERLFMRETTPKTETNEEEFHDTPVASMFLCNRILPFAGAWILEPVRAKSFDTPIPCNISNENMMELRQLRKVNEKLACRLRLTERRVSAAVRRLKDDEQIHARTIRGLQRTIAKQKIDLKNEIKTTQSLRLQVAKQESQLSKAYSNAMSARRDDVSRDMPDDMIRGTLSSFFKGDFFSWCADMSASEIDVDDMAEAALRRYDLVNRSQSYRSGPAHLQFDCSENNESASLVLLEAALSSVLCHKFLTTPFFMIQDHKALSIVEDTIAETSIEEAINWRVNTLKSLGEASPLTRTRASQSARSFVQQFGFLLNEVDQVALDDLVELFVQFSEIALKLWATKTVIRVLHGANIWGYRFGMRDAYLECDPGIASTLGEQLNGRPIGVLMRPCILSTPVPKAGQRSIDVVWSKALVWVSSEEDPAA